MKYHRIITAAACIIVTVLFHMSNASAQSFTKLTSTSKYACIRPGNGKNHVGVATKKGYRPLGFDVVQTDLTGLARKFKNDIERLTIDEEEFKDNKQLKNALKSFSSIVKALTDMQGSDFTTAEQRLIEINSLKQILKGKIADIHAQLAALQNCKKNKLPSLVSAEYRVVPGVYHSSDLANGYVTEVAATIEVLAILVSTKSSYCLHLDDISNPLGGVALPSNIQLRFSNDACNPDEAYVNYPRCPAPSDYLAAPVLVYDNGVPMPTDQIQALEGALTSKFSGTVSIKLIKSGQDCPA